MIQALSRIQNEARSILDIPAEQVSQAQKVNGSDRASNIDWPSKLGDDAYHGLAGEIVRQISPETEADEAAILLQFLVAFGALVGRGPHVRVEGDQHHGNLFALLVGETSKARKGTSYGRIKEIFSRVQDWPRVVEGLSSGEGLKWHVRDRVTKEEKDANGQLANTEVDPGISDKRLLVVESEFAQVLRQCARAGNTLSSTIRCAWDSGKLQTLTKNDPVTATGAHICMIGHITSDELRAELTQTDSANGFANRFLFMCVRRSKALAFGGKPIPDELLSQFASRIARSAGRAKMIQSVNMTEAARATWAKVYPTLSEGYRGLFGAVTARAEAQCLRLALLYALLDESECIDDPHVMAALSIWDRAAESARYVFGSALGDPVADEIYRSLRASGNDGLTRTGISKLFNRHQTAERIKVALDLLETKGMARSERMETTGAPSEVWRSV